MEVGGIEPHTRIAAQGLTGYCDRFVTTFEHLLDAVSSSLHMTEFLLCDVS